MSLFFGGGAKSKPQFTGLAAQTSSSSVAITIMWGQNRVAPNIIWEGDFKSHKVKKQGKGGGGKGGGQYTYSASFQLALCWGVVDSIETVWKDTSKTSPAEWSGVSYNFFGGTTPQSPWGYLTSRHPTEAIGYPGISHIDLANYDLGSSNSLGQHSFELKGPLQGTGPGDSLDADPALIVDDFLDNDAYGVGFDMANVVNLMSTGAASTTGDSAFQTYCRAMGFALSPILSTQEPATTILARWGQLCNTAVLWNGYQVKFFPYGPDPVTANGVTYLPDFPIRYQLNDRHFICGKNEDPVKFDRVDPWDAYNSLSIIISNRANEYNELPVSWRDQGLVDQYKKLRKDEDLQAKEICEISMAEVVVSLIGQRKAYIRNTFKFTLPTNFSLLEPMDVVGITDRVLGYIVVLIQSVDEDDDDNLSIVADEFYAPLPTAAVGQGVTNNPKNTFVIPGPVNPPLIFEPPGGGQIWLALSGDTPPPTPPVDPDPDVLDLTIDPSTLAYFAGANRSGDLGAPDSWPNSVIQTCSIVVPSIGTTTLQFYPSPAMSVDSFNSSAPPGGEIDYGLPRAAVRSLHKLPTRRAVQVEITPTTASGGITEGGIISACLNNLDTLPLTRANAPGGYGETYPPVDTTPDDWLTSSSNRVTMIDSQGGYPGLFIIPPGEPAYMWLVMEGSLREGVDAGTVFTVTLTDVTAMYQEIIDTYYPETP